jgi:alkanesulfonate monooxygenase SsuD/methylene tetrahydromethanopterin reductase-like flavin-dependent oxidoreductase (luciferase family)
VVLAAIAQTTKRIRLTSAVTVLSAADPVRIFQDFSTVDIISGGRAEIIAGRGVFTEPFPLFGFDLRDYDQLFSEKLDLLRKLSRSERITWSGNFRSPLQNAEISPRPIQRELPIWIGVGGSPQSAVRAGNLGLPMALAVLGGPITAIKPIVDLYREAGERAGHPLSNLKVSINSHAYIGEDARQAQQFHRPFYQRYLSEATPRGKRPVHISPADFQSMTGPGTALMVGSAQEVIDKIMQEYELLHHDRFLAQIDVGRLPFREVAKAIERFGEKVAPVIRAETTNNTPKRTVEIQPRTSIGDSFDKEEFSVIRA